CSGRLSVRRRVPARRGHWRTRTTTTSVCAGVVFQRVNSYSPDIVTMAPAAGKADSLGRI
ncbi:MAG: hypothetical protein OEW00_13650, partial [candidate division Zixibacteria bacterium]|nr:hypothetical protein [candidate division Zixibacteria bacterium]